MKKAQKRFVGSALAAASVLSAVAPVVVSAAEVSVEQLVQNALNSKTFYEFNIAYGEVMKLEGKDPAKFNELLGKLGTIATEVQTAEIKELNLLVDKIAYELSGRAYDEFEAKVNASTTLRAVDKGYYLGELARWGKSHVWTADYTAAVESVGKLWTTIDKAGVDAAKAKLAKLSGDNATYLTELLNEVVKAKGYVDVVGISSLKAVGAKKLEVKFNAPIDDAKAVVEVKKGSATPSIATKTYSADKTTLTIELTGKLTEGEYSVNVTGIAASAISSKVTVTDEKVASIKMLADVATAVVKASDYTVEGLKASYKVENQYGEDISKTTSLIANSSAGPATASNGEITIEVKNAGYVRIGDKVSIALINSDSQVSMSATLTVSNEAKTQSIEVLSLYNKDKKQLDEDAEASDFMIVLEAKDQYGNKVKATDLEKQVLVNVSNPTIFTVNGLKDSKAKFETLKIDGEDKIVLKLAEPTDGLKAGKATVTFIPTSGGNTTSYEIEVKDGEKVNRITFFQPDAVSAGKAVKVPFEAYDVFDKLITDADVLNDTVTLSFGGNAYDSATEGKYEFKQDYSTGKPYLEVKPTKEGIFTINATTSTYKYDYISLNVKEKAYAKYIIGVDSDAPTNALVNEKFTIEPKNLIVQDQYGRIMSDDDFKATLVSDGYKLVIKDLDEDNKTFGVDEKVLTTTTLKATFTAAATNGNKRYEFSIQDKEGKKVSGSEYEISSRALKLSELKTYEVADVTIMFDEGGYENSKTNSTVYNKDFTVYGKASDGSKVKIPSVKEGTTNFGYYSILATNSVLVPSVHNENVKAVLDVINTTGSSIYAKDTDTLSAQFDVVLNHSGDRITKDVIISKAKPVVASLEFENDNADIKNAPSGTTITRTTNGTVADGIETGAVYTVELGDTTLDAADVLPIVLLKDQYGKETWVADATTGRFDYVKDLVSTYITSVTFSDKSRTEITLESNGSVTSAKAKNVKSGDVVTVTFRTENGKVASAKIVIK